MLAMIGIASPDEQPVLRKYLLPRLKAKGGSAAYVALGKAKQ